MDRRAEETQGLSGAAALVTGASRGLGRALAGELARRGARVAMVARGRDALEEAAAGIRAAGGQAHAVPADVAHKDAIYPLVGLAQDRVGPIDLLIHNASALGPTPLGELSALACEDLEAVLAANLVGPFRLTKAVVGGMVARGRGTVAFVSSDAAVEPYPRWGAYGASKAAADHMARIWAAELAGTGVRVVAVDPGEMDTAMHAAAMPDADPHTLARPDDVARAIASLLLDAERAPSGARVVARVEAAR
jgi:NAD(P)-dependent dehydrogenase (short-subunit alcohol dehydrogenase family)